MRVFGSRAIATALSCFGLFAAREAGACGGCFAPPGDATTVTGHRMAFSISEERTVLWDQFEYSGAPEDFSWVLPVRPGAYLESATDAWFEALETFTQTVVYPPQLACAQSESGGCGLGGDDEESALGGSGPNEDGGVTVLHRGTVGPYETVTLRSDEGDALTAWLDENGYQVPEDIEPIIAAYVREGADFVALRLQPGRDVGQMTPVRVVTPGGDPILPMRMVAAGVEVAVDIVLYVIGEARYGMPDLQPVRVDPEELVYDFAQGSSNYEELREIALADLVGFNYLTSFADRAPFDKSYEDPSGFPRLYFSSAGDVASDFAGLFFHQAQANRDTGQRSECASVYQALRSSDVVVAEGAGAAELDASQLVCDGHDDLAAALIGMRPARTRLTRQELHLPRAALSMDCIIEPETSQDPVSSALQAVRADNRPAWCDQAVFESRLAQGRPGPVTPWLLAAAAALLVLRRRRGSAS